MRKMVRQPVFFVSFESSIADVSYAVNNPIMKYFTYIDKKKERKNYTRLKGYIRIWSLIVDKIVEDIHTYTHNGEK